MIRAFGRVLDGLKGNLVSHAVVELAGYGVAAGAPGLGHRLGSAYTTLKAYSAYTRLGDKV